MTEFIANQIRHHHRIKKLRQKVNCADQGQIVGRPRIGNNDRHGLSKAELIERPLLAVEIRLRIGLEHSVPFEKTIDLIEDKVLVPGYGHGRNVKRRNSE